MIVHIEISHGARSYVINDQSPYLRFGYRVALVDQPLMLRGLQGAALQHIIDLLANSAIVLARQSVPEPLL